MHILLTNDDGVSAPGLLALKQALAPLGKVTVVAPSRNYSAAGHRKTMHKPLRIDETQLSDGSSAWVCSGAPSDCVGLALLGFVKEKIDLVVSGINPHPNLGQDVTYSGTVTAAIEAVIAGVPGIAVSTATGGALAATGGALAEAESPADFESAAGAAARIIAAAARHRWPANTLLNINVPPPPIKSVRVTRQGRRIYRDELVERRDPRGRPYYWIGGEMPGGIAEEGTDFWALEQGYVSVTPLQLDLTAYNAMGAVEAWLGSET